MKSNIPPIEDQVSEILKKPRWTRAEAETVRAFTHNPNPLPPADGKENGKPYWNRETIRDWAQKVSYRSRLATPLQHRTAALTPSSTTGRPATWDGTNRTFTALVTSETPVPMYDWDLGRVVPEVMYADGGELPSSVPLLSDHQRTIRDTKGKMSNPQRDGIGWTMVGEIGRGDDEDAIARKIESGYITGVSVGYEVLERVRLKPGESFKHIRNNGDGVMVVATKWRLLEVSLVPLPADPAARIRSQQGTNSMPAILSPSRGIARNLDECFERDRVPFNRDRVERLDWYRTHANIRATAIWGALTAPAEVFVGEGYDGTEDSTRGWVSEIDVPNFLQFEVGRITDTHLTRQPRGAEADHGDLEAVAGNLRVNRFSRQTSCDDMDIVNADRVQGSGFVSGIVFRQFGRAAREVRMDLVYAMLLSNPEMADAEDLFSAAHNNDHTCTLAELDATLSEVAAAMAAQTNYGSAVNLRPDYFISASALEREVRKQVQAVDLYSKENTPAPIVRSDARIDTGVIDPTGGVVVAGAADTIFVASGVDGYGVTVGYLEGDNRRPSLTGWPLTRGSFGIGYAVKQVLGIAVTDYRGLARITITE